MLYSINNAYPTSLPERIRKADGMTVTGLASRSEDELNELGIVKVNDPPEVSELQDLTWSGTEWVVSNKPDGEIETITEAKRNEIEIKAYRKLCRTDWFVIRKFETGIEVPAEITAYRQALRGIKDEVDPFNVDWPPPPEGIASIVVNMEEE